MNEPAIERFEGIVKQGGYVFVNASLVPNERAFRKDVKVVLVDTEALAKKVGNPKGGNISMLGAVSRITKLFDRDLI